MNDMVMIPNSRISNKLGSNADFLTMASGAVQLLSWNEFMGPRGINVIDQESYKQTVIRDPRTGIPIDFQLNNDCGKIHVNLKIHAEAKGLPTDMFQSGDRYNNVTYVNKYQISNP